VEVAIPARQTTTSHAYSYASRVLWIMFAINFLNYMDRFILPSVLSSIQKEFQISDFQAGLLATAFTLVNAVAALPFGLWADRGIRKNVVAVGVGLWSLATLLTGAAANFLWLFAARAGVGVGEAGYYPAGTSLLVDYYPKERRAWMLGVWNVGASLGVAVGFAAGGIIADHWGWRWAFYFTIIPGAICTLLAFRMREPRRGGDAAAPLAGTGAAPAYAARTRGVAALPYWTSVQAVLKVRSMRFAVIAQTMNFFVLGAAVVWFPTLLQRRFQMSEGNAGLISGGVLVLAGIAGTLGGGWLADRLLPRRPSARLLVTGWAFLLSAPLLVFSLLANTLAFSVPLFFLAGACLQAYNGPMSALMQDVVRPELRAVAVAVSLVVAHILGDAFSPSLVGGLSDIIGRGHPDTLGHNLTAGLGLTLPPMILAAGIVCMVGLRYVQRDTQAAELAVA